MEDRRRKLYRYRGEIDEESGVMQPIKKVRRKISLFKKRRQKAAKQIQRSASAVAKPGK